MHGSDSFVLVAEPIDRGVWHIQYWEYGRSRILGSYMGDIRTGLYEVLGGEV